MFNKYTPLQKFNLGRKSSKGKEWKIKPTREENTERRVTERERDRRKKFISFK